MEQRVHLEIEILVTKRTMFHRESDIGNWCWAMSYSPTKEESLGFNALLSDGLRPLPSNISRAVLRKMITWRHQDTASWFYISDIIDLLEDPHVPFTVRNWFLSWASENIALLGNPNQFRVVIWITEGMHD